MGYKYGKIDDYNHRFDRKERLEQALETFKRTGALLSGGKRLDLFFEGNYVKIIN